MSKLPDNRALLAVLFEALIQARVLAREGVPNGLNGEHCSRISALMDAVHNLPNIVCGSHEIDERDLKAELQEYDDTWGQEPHFRSLLEIYNFFAGNSENS